MTTIDKLFTVQARQNTIWRLLEAGSLDIDDVLAAMKGILDGVYPLKPAVTHVLAKTPSWYVSPEQQLERVIQLNAERRWGLSMSVRPIPEFTPRTETEVLLLTICFPTMGKMSGLQRTFDELWRLSEAPTGYTKWSLDGRLTSDAKHLRQAPGYDYTPGIRWVVFDPDAYRGKSPEQALELAQQDNVQLAGLEGLMANLLFPTWAASWNGKSSSYPWLAGLQFNWSYSVYLYRWDDYRWVDLRASWSDGVDSSFSSPSVRECWY